MFTAEEISELIFKIKTCNGQERERYVMLAKKKLKINTTEKILTKLRMYLVKIGAEISFFNLTSIESKKQTKNKEMKNKKCKPEALKRIQKTQAKRMTKEEKQLAKLRLSTIPETKSHYRNIKSKSEFLKATGLEPLVIVLN